MPPSMLARGDGAFLAALTICAAAQAAPPEREATWQLQTRLFDLPDEEERVAEVQKFFAGQKDTSSKLAAAELLMDGPERSYVTGLGGMSAWAAGELGNRQAGPALERLLQDEDCRSALSL